MQHKQKDNSLWSGLTPDSIHTRSRDARSKTGSSLSSWGIYTAPWWCIVNSVITKDAENLQ